VGAGEVLHARELRDLVKRRENYSAAAFQASRAQSMKTIVSASGARLAGEVAVLAAVAAVGGQDHDVRVTAAAVHVGRVS
jgi:hypothetical protein